jgi:hypothetical protein
VSRISDERYVHTGRSLQAIQVDAAINGGASGGALLKDGRLVGLLFQMAPDEQNVGQAIPLTVIRQFLKDAGDGEIQGTPALGVSIEYVQNPMKRARYGLGERHALEIIQASAHARAQGLHPGALILALNGVAIGPGGWLEGTTPSSLRMAVARHQIGERVTLTVQEDGEVRQRLVQLNHRWSDHYVVPIAHHDRVPPWLVLAGLVLVQLTDGYFDSVSDASETLHELSGKRVDDSDCLQQAVVISNLLPHRLNQDYQRHVGEQVVAVNGARIQNFQHLNYLVRSTTSDWIELVTASGGRLLFDRAALAEAEADIARRWQLPDTPFPAPPDSLSGICH